jgi:hypothetical protein
MSAPLERAAVPDTLPAVARAFLGHWSPRILIVTTTVLLGARVAVGRWSPWDLAVVAGTLALWPVLEWVIHVCILHFRPFTLMGRTVDFRVPRSHRAHHRDPTDLALVFIPTHVFVYAVPLQLALWFGLMPSTPLALTGLAFYMAMALHYEWTHFLVHTRYTPASRYYRRLWRNHRLHHYKNEHYWFGVTMLGGDRLLGTAASADRVATSPTCRTLGLETTLGLSS